MNDATHEHVWGKGIYTGLTGDDSTTRVCERCGHSELYANYSGTKCRQPSTTEGSFGPMVFFHHDNGVSVASELNVRDHGTLTTIVIDGHEFISTRYDRDRKVGAVPHWIMMELKKTWEAARNSGSQLEAFRIFERLTDRLGYGRMSDNPPYYEQTETTPQ